MPEQPRPKQVPLREDNNTENCTVMSDPEGKVGRKHFWHWWQPNSPWRVCGTCGRCEEMYKVWDDKP